MELLLIWTSMGQVNVSQLVRCPGVKMHGRVVLKEKGVLIKEVFSMWWSWIQLYSYSWPLSMHGVGAGTH